ncbi:MAG: 50S ribosomal protein L20 [Rhodospirillales bacterium]|nr:50S ribosomal protein L20 [Rhodospirillales bacterium]
MARVKRGVTSHARHKKVLKLARGYRERNRTVFRVALEKVEKALQYAYRDRRAKKRNFRGLWIQRINAGVRQHGMTYSQFMNGIKHAGIDLDRKVLADLAVREPDAFKVIVDEAQSALAKAVPAAQSSTAQSSPAEVG